MHVVWQNDTIIKNKKEEIIPCLELHKYVNQSLIEKYQKLMMSKSWILCQPYLKNVDSFLINHFLERLLIERLEQKTHKIISLFEASKNDWEHTFYATLCNSFGLKINAYPMKKLSQLLPLSILLKHKNYLFQLEALLFGVGGFLKEVNDEYSHRLKKEYIFLKHKYNLEELEEREWMFMRLRPSSFPTIRIAQLAQLLYNNTHFFSKIIDAKTLNDLKKLFQSSVSDYWLNHYHFKKTSIKRKKAIGNGFLNTIIINSIFPLLFVYSQKKSIPEIQQRVIQFLEEMKGEKNAIIKKFSELGIQSQNAAQSQALIQLYNCYCKPKKCLNCNIGNLLLNQQ